MPTDPSVNFAEEDWRRIDRYFEADGSTRVKTIASRWAGVHDPETRWKLEGKNAYSKYLKGKGLLILRRED